MRPMRRRRRAGPPPEIGVVPAVDPDGAVDDWASIASLVSGARYVGLGETVHTSGGFYRAKHCVVRYLVSQCGFRALALETSWRPASALAEYLATGEAITATDKLSTGESDLATILTASVFPVWACEELVALLRWLRQWNVEHPDDQVTCFGFDIQEPDFATVRSAVDDELASELDYAAPALDHRGPVTVTADGHRRAMAAYDGIDAWIDRNRPDDVDLRLAAISLRAHEANIYHSHSTKGPGGVQGGEPNHLTPGGIRDAGMASAFRLQADRHASGAKVAIWAHNGHLARATDRSGILSFWVGRIRSMGTLLHAELGPEYVPIALTGHRVKINWPGLRSNSGMVSVGGSGLSSRWSVERRLHRFGHPAMVIDLRAENAALFRRGRKRWFGNPGQGFYDIHQQFDGIIYVDDSPGMTSIL